MDNAELVQDESKGNSIPEMFSVPYLSAHVGDWNRTREMEVSRHTHTYVCTLEGNWALCPQI